MLVTSDLLSTPRLLKTFLFDRWPLHLRICSVYYLARRNVRNEMKMKWKMVVETIIIVSSWIKFVLIQPPGCIISWWIKIVMIKPPGCIISSYNMSFLISPYAPVRSLRSLLIQPLARLSIGWCAFCVCVPRHCPCQFGVCHSFPHSNIPQNFQTLTPSWSLAIARASDSAIGRYKFS